ncbi:MAG: sulfatase family protein [Acidimicrobiales bacterium]
MAPRPNVLLFLCDQMQYQRQGPIDPVAHTPALTGLAADGVFFTHMLCANAQCVPSRASIQTGLYPHEANVMANFGLHGHSRRLNAAHRTVGHAFQDAGYDTAYFGKTHFGTDLVTAGYGMGVDSVRPVDHILSLADDRILSDVLTFLDVHEWQRPLFLTVSLQEPHPPFETIAKFSQEIDKDAIIIPESFYQDDLSTKPPFQLEHATGQHRYASEEELRLETWQYYSMIAKVDEAFGAVRAAFEDRSEWDRTVAVFTSDHGDMMGAHGMRLKGTLPYDELFRVPLVVRLPGNENGGLTVDDLCVNVSLPGTLLETADLDVPAAMRGGSLVEALSGRGHGRARVFFEHYAAYWGVHPFRGVRTNHWKYVHYYGADATEELYDLSTDPHELDNRANHSDVSAVQSELAAEVENWWKATGGRDYAYYESPEFKSGTTGKSS